jgi:acyl carrier protein
VLAECLLEIFQHGQFDFEQTFSEAGGDSLGAIQLLTLLIEKHFTIEIADIINPEHTLRDIARLLVPHISSITKKPVGAWEKPIEWSDEQFTRVVSQYGRENIERIYDLTLLQNSLLSFCVTHPGDTFHLQNSYTVQGHLDLELCCTAFALVARKHPVLQTAIVYRDLPTPKQLIISNRGLEIGVVVNEPIDKVVKQEFRRGFDFEKDNLLRIILLKDGEQYTHIIVSVHHLIIDGLSFGVLMNDFTETYGKLAKGAQVSLVKEEIERERQDVFSHEDFVNYVQGLDQEAAIAYFVKKLDGYNGAADLTHDYPNTQGNWACSIEFLDIPQDMVEGIRAVARQCQVSPVAIYEGVYAFVLQQACGSSDVVFSSLSNGRGYPLTNIANIFGFFFSRMSVRVTVTEDSTFADLFTVVQKQLGDDLKYEYVDFIEVEKYCGYRTCFNYLQIPSTFTIADDVSISFDMEYHTAYENLFFTVEVRDTTRLRVEYNTYIYAPATIKRFLNSYLSVLEYVVTHTHTKAKFSEVLYRSKTLRRFSNTTVEKTAIPLNG